MQRYLFSSCVALLVGTSFPALAQEEDPAAARVLFDEGRQLAARGDYQHACPKFEESHRLRPGLGSLFNLADCWEHVGRTASAWARFSDVAAMAARAQDGDREEAARERAAALTPKLAKLKIVVDADEPNLMVMRDGTSVRRAAWGSSVPLDPGEHLIEASAPGKKSWRATVTAIEGVHATVVVPDLEVEAPRAKPRSIGPVRQQRERAPNAEPSHGQSNRLQNAAWGLAGAGLAAGVYGLVSSIMFRSNNEAALQKCVPHGACGSTAEKAAHDRLVESATTQRAHAIIGFTFAASAFVGAAILFGSRAGSTHTQIGVATGPGRLEVDVVW